MLYDFIIKNLLISTLLITFIITLIFFEINEFIHSKNSISPQKAINLINREHAIILDFRSKIKFKQCYIINSINTPYDDVRNHEKIFKKYKKNIIIIIHINNKLAQKAIEKLKKINTKSILYIIDGIEGWKKEQLPIKQNNV